MIGLKPMFLVAVMLVVLIQCARAVDEDRPAVKVSSRPLHSGHINPMLFGGFMELLDDLIPGMWAEMLNDRSFEGLQPSARWCYQTGEPNFCDREWDKSDCWTYESDLPFNGARSVKITAKDGQAALTQSGLAVRKGARYRFSGWFRTDTSSTRTQVVLKAKLPDGRWTELASAVVPNTIQEWHECRAELTATGTTDRAVFELRVSGKGGVWVDKLSLMPSDNVDGWRKDVIAAVKEMRPGIIRWGGSVCDPGGYRWKNGIGDRDARVPFANAVWGRIDSNDVGIDEFCRFCELVGVEPLVCISYSDGSQSAADLVQYCNGGVNTEWGAKRTANGHPEPYNVRYWQLGNELGDANYVNRLPEFCRAMKQVDAKAVLMASFPSQEMLDKAGKDISYIGPHHYTPDFPGCEADFRKLSEMIRNTPGCDHIRIAVTEWNITAGDFGLGRGKLMSLESALQNARYLNLLMRYSDIVDVACRSNMANSLGSGCIATNPSGLLKRPSYYAMKLYADHAKPIPLEVGTVPEGVDVMACRSEDGRSVCVFVVNMKRDPVDLSLDLSEFGQPFRPAEGEMLCDTLDMRQTDITNHWNAPDRIKTVQIRISGDTVALPALSAMAIECK